MKFLGHTRKALSFLPSVVVCSAVFFLLYLNSFVDQYFVNLCGPVAAKAYSISMPLYATIMALAGVFGIGATIVVREHWKHGDDVSANQSACNSIVYSATVGLGVTILMVAFMLPIMQFVVVDDVYFAVLEFLFPFLFLFVGIAINSVFISLMILDGGSKAAIVCQVSMVLANIVCDRFFVNVMGFGILGNGLGSALSACVSATLAYLWFRHHKGRIEISRRYFSPSISGFRKSVQHLHMFFTRTVVVNMGEQVIRLALYATYALSYGIPMLCAGLASVMASGCGPALAPKYEELAHNADLRRAREVFRWSIFLGLVVMGAFTAVIYIFADPIVSLFTRVPGLEETHEVIKWTLRVLCFTAPFLGLRAVCNPAILPYGSRIEDTAVIIAWTFVRTVLFFVFLYYGYMNAIYFILFERIAVGIYDVASTWRLIGKLYVRAPVRN